MTAEQVKEVYQWRAAWIEISAAGNSSKVDDVDQRVPSASSEVSDFPVSSTEVLVGAVECFWSMGRS